MRELYHAVLFDLYGTLIDDTATAMPGALERVAECTDANWGIVTSAGTVLARKLLAHARIPVPDVLITGHDVAHNKPAPDGYLLAASRLKVAPGKSLAIEDTAGGIAAARAAGMDVVAVMYGRSADFCSAATFAIDDLTKLRLRVVEGAVELLFL